MKYSGRTDSFYFSSAWKRKRKYILARDKYVDKIAIRYGSVKNATVVHHIFPFEYFPEYKLSNWNLISLSVATHNTLHDRNNDLLTDKGMQLLYKTARKNNIVLDEQIERLRSAHSSKRFKY